ncbi:MAG: hypothetical protein JOY61_01270 [Chloroflexi bacterium]|nr:hypothetical protein [Chloroflexota bacterium]
MVVGNLDFWPSDRTKDETNEILVHDDAWQALDKEVRRDTFAESERAVDDDDQLRGGGLSG